MEDREVGNHLQIWLYIMVFLCGLDDLQRHQSQDSIQWFQQSSLYTGPHVSERQVRVTAMEVMLEFLAAALSARAKSAASEVAAE